MRLRFPCRADEWRRELHQHPELCFEEHWTSDFVASKLDEMGIEVHHGLAGTGVVGKLVGRSDNGRAIGLRADMDALPINEINDGKAADLLIVDGDPTADIKMASEIENHRMVIKGGVVAKAR